MGTDIYVHFERHWPRLPNPHAFTDAQKEIFCFPDPTSTDEVCLVYELNVLGWQPLWQPKPHAEWWEWLIKEKQEMGKLLTFSNEPEKINSALKSHFSSLSIEEAIARYGEEPSFRWEWHDVPDSRDYEWFAALGLKERNEDGPTYFELKHQLPNDISEFVARRFDKSYHSPSYLMVSDILAERRVAKFKHVAWMEEHIPEPWNTRMVFWFDN